MARLGAEQLVLVLADVKVVTLYRLLEQHAATRSAWQLTLGSERLLIDRLLPYAYRTVCYLPSISPGRRGR